jgi:hypothetical protein
VLVWLISPERSPPMSYSSLSGGVLPLFSITSAKDPAVGALTRVGSSRGLGRPSGPRVSGPTQWSVSVFILVFPFILFTDLHAIL